MMFNSARKCKFAGCPYKDKVIELHLAHYVRLNQEIEGVKAGFYHLDCFQKASGGGA